MLSGTPGSHDGNPKSFLDDKYTIDESKYVKVVITRPLSGSKEIGQILNICKEIVRLGVTIICGGMGNLPEEYI